MRLRHERVELVLVEGGDALAARSPPVVGVDLDPVGAASGLLAHRFEHLWDAAHRLRPLRQIEVRAKAARPGAVARGRDDGAGRDLEPRPRDEAAVDGAL